MLRVSLFGLVDFNAALAKLPSFVLNVEIVATSSALRPLLRKLTSIVLRLGLLINHFRAKFAK